MNSVRISRRTYAIEKKFTFEAAHYLDGLCKDHPCATIHGHSYKVYVKIHSYKIDDNGFIIDFSDLKKFKTEYIDKLLDHSLIETEKQSGFNLTSKRHILPEKYKNTTVENLCEYLNSLLLEFFEKIEFNNFYKLRVKIFETENNSGEFVYKIIER